MRIPLILLLSAGTPCVQNVLLIGVDDLDRLPEIFAETDGFEMEEYSCRFADSQVEVPARRQQLIPPSSGPLRALRYA